MAVFMFTLGNALSLKDDGTPNSGGKAYFFEPGTATPKTTYTTVALSVANANPVVFDSAGRANIYFEGDADVQIKDSTDVLIHSEENVNPTTNSTITAISGATTLDADHNTNTIEVSGTTTVSLTAAATLGAGWYATIKNAGVGVVTIARLNAGDSINGVSSSFYLNPGDAAVFQVNAAETGFITYGSLHGLLTTAGDVVYAEAANKPKRLAIGTSRQILHTLSGVPAWRNFPNFDFEKLTSGTTWTSPADITADTVFEFTLVGAGGGGGGTNGGATTCGQGGGAGGAFTMYLSGLAASTNYTYAIGTAGTAGSAGGNGGTGGDTTLTIGATTYTAAGGTGGAGTGAATSVRCAAQGSVTNNPADSFLIYQAPGAAGTVGTNPVGKGGDGASLPPFGGGGDGGLSGVTNNGSAATGYGAGGGGGIGNPGSGAAGTQGLILIRRIS